MQAFLQLMPVKGWNQFLIVDSGLLDRTLQILQVMVEKYLTMYCSLCFGVNRFGGSGFVGSYCPQTKWTLSICLLKWQTTDVAWFM